MGRAASRVEPMAVMNRGGGLRLPHHAPGEGASVLGGAAHWRQPPGARIAPDRQVHSMKTRILGPYTVSAIGLGTMPLSSNRERRFPTEDEAIATIRAALEAGVTFIDMVQAVCF
jgi:hypothetical protein